VITPRRIRLFRAPGLAAYRQHLADLSSTLTSDAFVLVPTMAAAEQILRTNLKVRYYKDSRGNDSGDNDSGGNEPLGSFSIGSRADLDDHLITRLPSPLRLLTPFEREAMLAAGAREAEESGAAAPFHVRPALIAEMLGLYDRIRRLGRTIDDFDRLLTGELEPAADSDRGAAQLLEQTRFLAAAFRAYEARLADGDGAD
jgi:hypothetical protein